MLHMWLIIPGGVLSGLVPTLPALLRIVLVQLEPVEKQGDAPTTTCPLEYWFEDDVCSRVTGATWLMNWVLEGVCVETAMGG